MAGLRSEGIFRVAPDATENDQTLDQINSGGFDADAWSGDAAIMANLIKVWFRVAPEGYKLFEVIDRNIILTCDMFGDADVAEKAMEAMPEPHKSLMLWLLDLMCDVLDHADVNRMSVRALSVVVSPNLFNFEMSTDPTQAMQALTFAQKAVVMMQKMLKWRLTVVRPDAAK